MLRCSWRTRGDETVLSAPVLATAVGVVDELSDVATSYRQPKREWLAAIDSGEMQYHSAEEKSVNVRVTNDTAVVVGRSVVDATIFGSRGTWNLQLTTDYARKGGKWIANRTVATTF
jgi:hypothetical protein